MFKSENKIETERILDLFFTIGSVPSMEGLIREPSCYRIEVTFQKYARITLRIRKKDEIENKKCRVTHFTHVALFFMYYNENFIEITKTYFFRFF